MGKYDHIGKLTEAENYPQWKCQIIEHLWLYYSKCLDPSNLADLASIIPSPPTNPKAIIKVETEKILDWLAKDAQPRLS